MSEIKNLKPECIWRNFYSLTQVPRPSGHLEKIQQFLLNFGQQAGVTAFKDPAGNIVFRKPATAGMENRKGIILQAHMDMVPQKTPESTHNFETDPIEPWIDGEWVKAKGTTLGADNGLGVAAIMAIMEDKTLKHGPIDALITRDEETGMYGANELPASVTSGQGSQSSASKSSSESNSTLPTNSTSSSANSSGGNGLSGIVIALAVGAVIIIAAAIIVFIL